MFEINNYDKRVFVVDNFYKDPDAVRDFALKQKYAANNKFYKGMRSTQHFRPPELQEVFESIIGENILDFDMPSNGIFQITSAENPQVYHCDDQKWAGMVYLTPSAPIQSGTRTHMSISTGVRDADDPNIEFSGGFYDSTKFNIVDSIGNIYNRLAIFNGRLIHSAGPYFGLNMWDGRLIHLFFWN